MWQHPAVPKILALLTVLVLALPAIIVSLWWTALCSRLLQRAPAGDAWETQVSPRRAVRLLMVALLLAGCAAIFWGWTQIASSQLDTLGLRPLADWALETLQAS